MSKLEKYWKELQRRHVVKAGLAYLVVAWLVLQVLDLLLDAFQLGAGWMQTAIITLSVGFPIWLILAWVYDFSWGSIQKTEDVPFDAEVSRKKNIGLNRVIIGGLAIAVVLLLVNTLRLSNKVDEIEGQFLVMEFTNSLAILPFKDLSPKQDQRYFSDGLARSIYDRLARSKDLKLISPTSSFQYRDQDVSIEVIAEELGVRYILEGSVQLFEDQYRASINLVDTRDGSTIWSKTFRDQIADILRTYDDVSENVGNYLKVTLASEDVRRRKVDPEAYLLYLKAMDTILYYTRTSRLAADSLIKESLRIDPSYAPSHATLSMTTLHVGVYESMMSYEEAIRIGKKAALKANELDSTYYWGYTWLSNWQWHERNTQGTQDNLIKSLKLAPNNADVYSYIVHQSIRTNDLKKANEALQIGLELDPKNAELYEWKLWLNIYLADFEQANESLNNKFENTNDDWGYYGYKAYISTIKGDYEEALNTLAQEDDPFLRNWIQSMVFYKLDRFEEANKAIEALKKSSTENINWNGLAMDIAAAYSFRDQKDEAFQILDDSFDEVCIYLENFFTYPEFRNLYDDPRWDAYLERLGEEFNYDFTHGS